MRIPNSFLSDLASDRSAFIVACRLYSLINPTTKISSNGYEVCIKQETIAASCNLSVSTVKRVLRRLADVGIITAKATLQAIWVQLITACSIIHWSMIISICLKTYSAEVFLQSFSMFTHSSINLSAMTLHVFIRATTILHI